MSFNLSPATEIRADSHGLVQLDLFGNPTSEEPTYYRSPHRVAYPGMSRNSRDRIETHTKLLVGIWGLAYRLVRGQRLLSGQCWTAA